MKTEAPVREMTVETDGYSRQIAVADRGGAAPGVFWMSGLMSDMAGTKATSLDLFCEARGMACTRFDYSAHGASGGSMEEASITRWLEESEAVFRDIASGPRIIIGSSMGGYLATLLAKRLCEEDPECPQIAAMVLIAPAIDMTERLMWEEFPQTVRDEIMEKGQWFRPSPYDESGYMITKRLIEDGRKHLLFDGPMLKFPFPVVILQGRLDEDVPLDVALDLVSLLDADVSLTVVPDGDHRLSRPQDIEMLEATVQRLADEAD
ncbi:alpha/beta hydrolase [Tepidamorphus sp. 3E244]|uniref:alpha/beta hydrolase n=1 Tax=Tepidamorphus sp. 3E244 TaxID=3385498 RepID=UPI0038FC9406